MERIRLEFDVQIVYRAFPLHPDTPEAGLTIEQLFSGRNLNLEDMQRRMKSLMEKEGLPYGQRTMTYNSRLAQELAAWAATQSNGDRIHRALFHAYFVDNINLAKRENLASVAAGAGFDSREVEVALQTRSGRAYVDRDWDRSRTLDITGVPAFVVGKHVTLGALTYQQLQSLLQTANVPKRVGS